LHLAFEPISHPNGGLGVHVCRNTEALEKHVEQWIINVPSHLDSWHEVKSIGRDRYSVTIAPETRHLVSNQGLELLHDQEVFFKAFAELCPHDFDIVHCHDTYMMPLALKIRALFGSKIVLTSHLLMADVMSLYGGLSQKWQHQIETEIEAYGQADQVITISKHYENFLKDLFFVDPEKMTLIYNGVDHAPKRATPNKEPKTIGYLGRAAKMKGLDQVMTAVDAFPHIKFKIITAVKGDAVDGFASGCIKFFESRPNVELVNGLHPDLKWPHMMDCDLAVMPSIREPWGLVSLEWMSAGVPLIASNVGGLKEIVSDHNAWPFDPPHLIDAIKSYKFDQSKIDSAFAFSDSFTWESCAGATMEVYRKCLQKS
jgi:glycosyltransferase involved in cell wall biosynthesis